MSGPTVRYRFVPARTPKAVTSIEVPPQPATPEVSRAARLLALAHHIERLVEAGDLADYADAARKLGITRARVAQVVGMTLLAPGIQEALLVTGCSGSPRTLRQVPREPDWTLQRDGDVVCCEAIESPRG